MKEAARNYSTVYPEAAEAIVFDTYVDDFLSGGQNKEEAMQLRAQVVEILKSAGFNLRKWSSNCAAVLDEVDRSEQNPVDVKVAEQPNVVKALGVQWRPEEDIFTFQVHLQPDSANTKRQLLSDASKLFDPFGWLSPVTVSIKILFQQLWLSGTSWDDPLPPAIEELWVKIKQSLHKLEQVRISRFAANYNGKVELHGFADASEAAYGAVVYTRTKDPDGNIVVNLLAAKTKVAPIKQVSLPRLELSAAVLLTELIERITESISHLSVEHWAWTDSTIVLQWLSAHPRKWKTYVANRTSAVLAYLPRECWNHVSSADNPADCASRGLTPDELLDHPLWFHGPTWLSTDEQNWRTGQDLPANVQQLPEERKVKVMHTVTQQRNNYFAERFILERRSDFGLVVRSLALFARSLKAWKGAKFDSGLTPEELQVIKAKLARMAQEDVFNREMELLAKGVTLPVKNKLASLYPFLDGNGTMRVGGRLQNSTCDYDVKHPIILPRDHRVTDLMLRELHQRNLHAGPTLLAATVRQQYWVIGLRTAVRRTVHGCVRCARLKGQTANQLMGSLPVPRVMGTRAFVHVGVDYAGPFAIRALCVRGVKTTKGYLAVFVCMSTKAVHLEVASDLSTGMFISALKRFIAKRGYPSEIWSENGTNFVGADRYLQEFQHALNNNNKSADQFLTNVGIKWVFNPPSAPHRGGIWEAAVKSVKRHLLAVVGSEATTYEELSTILTQVEACLNSRPLCALSNLPDCYDALTPGHFLVGQPLNLIPEPDVSQIPTNRLDMWQQMHKQTIEVWRRWRDEYLTSLQPRTKWRVSEDNVKENQLVLVKNDLTPPAQWELARIIKVHPDSSGIVRTVTLRRGQAEYLRPVQKICLLPTD
ncbi:uncharacterized protein LOC134291384 [Aedes albopictus]|uniref:Integrase catalytic domain-containing protein n=1 Tax=Aedes albopictus TaxID=7160 RepID=A0ABM1Y594_AEDAL